MRLAVTGGLGFIGTELVDQALAAGHDVLIVDDGSNAHQRSGVPIVRRDIAHGLPDGVFSGVDVVVHLAAMHYIPDCNRRPERCWAVNVDGTIAVGRAATTAEVSRLVFASSAAVYAPSLDTLHEESPIGPLDVYGRTKVVGEYFLRSLLARHDVDLRVGRLFNVYGPGDLTPHLIPALIERLRSSHGDVKVGDLSTARDYVHVSTAASALLALALSVGPPLKDTVNIATGVSTTGFDVFEMISEALGVDARPLVESKYLRCSDNPVLRGGNSLMIEHLTTPAVSLRGGINSLVADTLEQR